MYKKMFFAAAVVATFAGCTKNEVNPVQTADGEISYQAVVAPKTKAPSRLEFDDKNVFVSYAYYLPSDKTWAANSADAVPYITASTISKVGDEWKNKNTSYYWPKDGKLTFFSWSLDKDNTTLTTGVVDCNVTDGINATGYSAADNHNFDFMVADIAPDYTANVMTYYTTGVPTLFKHKLCQVAYTVKTDKEYPGATFNLKSVALSNIAQAGDYKQLATDEGWTSTDKTATYLYSSSVENNTFDNNNSLSPSLDKDQLYYIPQNFADEAAVTIVYSITNADGFVETVTRTQKLSDLFGEWNMNTKYMLNITVALDEILWDPAIEDWGTETSAAWTVK